MLLCYLVILLLSQVYRVLSSSLFLEVDNMIRDKIVFSTKEKAVKERLLRETDTTLKKVLYFCRSAEITKKEIQTMQSVKCDTRVKCARH